MNDERVDLYDTAYSHYASDAEAAVRQGTYGEDIGQSSWMTAGEWLEFASWAGVSAGRKVLEVGCGSGGPAVYLAERLGCDITGVDINEHGVSNARTLAADRRLAERARFQRIDANQPLPLPNASFDVVISNDAMCHIPQRAGVLADWFRLLRPGGRMLFTDALVVTGLVSHEEIATRSSIGFYLFVPPGMNEQLIKAAGFELLRAEDVTESAAVIATRWHNARARYRTELVGHEGVTNYEGLQRFLACVRLLSDERRLSRFCYLAVKPST
ncbi:MAG: class I SAM-dependent methyltransferase [Blastocatellia bacterium]|nr:MAG: class I SAM-dependent methyltransferase [Blastocatellia bacterium]